jgi:hypothetical protein
MGEAKKVDSKKLCGKIILWIIKNMILENPLHCSYPRQYVFAVPLMEEIRSLFGFTQDEIEDALNKLQEEIVK